MNVSNWASKNKVVVVFAIGLIAGIAFMNYLDKKKIESAFCC